MKKKNKKLRKPNILPKPPREVVDERENEDAMLSEFSDDYNDFFVDEVSQKEERREDDRRARDPRGKRLRDRDRKPRDRDRDRKPRDRDRDRDEKPTEKEPESVRRKPISPLRRKLRRIFSYVAIITVVIVVGVILSLTVLFKTRNYEVIGNSLYNESDIIEVCDIPEGTNIFLAPKKAAAERIKASFPYIEDVKVGFRIPDTIKTTCRSSSDRS